MSRLPPSPHLSPLFFYQLGRRKFASLSSSQEFTSQQKKESVGFTLVRLVGLAAHSFPDGKKRVGRLSAPISPVFPPMGNRPHEGMKPPLLAQCGPFLAIQPHKLVHPPQTLDFFQPPGAFLFSPKGGMPRIRAAAPQKIKKERCTGYQVHRPVFRCRRVPGGAYLRRRLCLCGPLRDRPACQPELQRPVPHGRRVVL